MQEPSEDKNKKVWHDWDDYYKLLGEKPHTKYLEIAVSQYCKEKNRALDVAAGNLRDTKFLLDQGFEVFAVDPAPSSSVIAEKMNHPKLTMLSIPAGAINFPDETFDIINAQGILFHFKKPQLVFILENLKKILKYDGILCADFIGEKDGWAKSDTKTIVTKESLEELLEGFNIELFEEKEQDESEETAQKKAEFKNDSDYKPKHWHHINIIAVKK